MAGVESWNKAAWERELYAQIREAQAAAVRATISPSDYSLRHESSARQELFFWFEEYHKALNNHPEWGD
jgi:hypothetical protein